MEDQTLLEELNAEVTRQPDQPENVRVKKAEAHQTAGSSEKQREDVQDPAHSGGAQPPATTHGSAALDNHPTPASSTATGSSGSSALPPAHVPSSSSVVPSDTSALGGVRQHGSGWMAQVFF